MAFPKDDASTQERRRPWTPAHRSRSCFAGTLRRPTIATWLKFSIFGIPWTAMTVGEANGSNLAALTADHPQFSILTSAPRLTEALQSAKAGIFPAWMAAAASVFVYGFQASDPCRALLREITGDPDADIRGIDQRPITVSVTDTFPDMCGPMSGLRIQLQPGAADAALVIAHSDELQSIVAAPEGYLFAGLTHSGLRLPMRHGRWWTFTNAPRAILM